MQKRFFIQGYYGWRNTGDDAMAYSILHLLESSYPGSSYTLLSNSPLELPQSLENSVRYISSSSIVEVLIEIKHSSFFILGGGTHFFDYGNKRRHLIRLSKMLLLLIWARIFCNKILFLGIGVESPRTLEGKALIKLMCSLADLIGARDSYTYELMKKWGIEYKTKQFSDLAVALRPLINSKSIPMNEGLRILGISILPFFEIYYEDKNKDKEFLGRISDCLEGWLEVDKGNRVRIFIFKGESRDDDTAYSKELYELLNMPERVELIPYQPNPINMLNKVAECHAFIGMRYHSCVFAYLANLPLLIIDYAEKNRAFASDIGSNANAILTTDMVLSGMFPNCFNRFINDPAHFISKISAEILQKRIDISKILA